MTTITLAYRKFSRSSGSALFSVSEVLNWVAAKERIICTVFVCGIVLSLALYIGALYVSFGLGTVVSEQASKISALSGEIRENEYQLQARTKRVPEEYKEFLSSMERVSNIRYVGAGEGYASLRNQTP